MDWHHIVPFAALMVNRSEESVKNRPLLTRLSEQTIVGIVAAGIALWTNGKLQENEISHLSKRQDELMVIIMKIQSDFYVPREAAPPPPKANVR